MLRSSLHKKDVCFWTTIREKKGGGRKKENLTFVLVAEYMDSLLRLAGVGDI